MLNSELQKLKASDMQKVHTRAKRLETRKKGEIINKEKKNEELVKLAKDLDLKCTFHKAFDECKNINQSLIELSEIGFDWVLTSGKEKNAELGLQNLKMLSKIKNRKIKILAGGGISGLNYHKFLNLGLDGIHFSIDKNNKIEVEKIISIKNGLKLY